MEYAASRISLLASIRLSLKSFRHHAGGYRGSISSIHATHGIPVFIYRSSGREMSCSSTDSSAEIEKKVTSHQRSQGVLANMLDYIFAYPWNLYPQAYSYCISITGKQLRLWKWEIDGCVATDLINYADDPTVLYQFLQFLGQGPYSKLGVDIGANEVSKPIALTESIREKMDKIISLNCAARTPSEALEEWKKTVAKHCALWTFRGWNAFEPDPTVYSQKIQTSVVVLSQPIYKNSSSLSKNTHCYLALPGAQFQDFHLDDRSIADVNVFKTSWKLIDSAHELRCYKAIGQRVGNIKCLPTLLAGGVMRPYYSIRRVVEDDLDENEDKKKQEKERSGKVQLDWSLLKEVGEDLMHCKSPAHLGQVMLGVFQAYLDLNKAHISYHKISPSCFMINLANKEGILIGIDSARIQPMPGYKEAPQHDGKSTGSVMEMMVNVRDKLLSLYKLYDVEDSTTTIPFNIDP
ncbi:hypothetical protein FRB91_005029 [Serendipita sp. 411]|nr:hypothetical protein FRC18_010498 [Serendipita sp. 400]KAG8841417.1 hypothetical protein FRB91_005029 [Serendipita sp. 411]